MSLKTQAFSVKLIYYLQKTIARNKVLCYTDCVYVNKLSIIYSYACNVPCTKHFSIAEKRKSIIGKDMFT